MSATTVTGNKAVITLVAMCAALMALIDITIVNVALSDIRASFGVSIEQIGWISTGYMMANIVIIPMTGFLQKRFGYRLYLFYSVLIFTIASALCGLAWNLPALVCFRVLQGLGGGAIIPTAQSVLLSRYPKEEIGRASALFGLGAVTGPLLGPTVGGYLIEWANWHWVFLVNVPIGAAVCLLALKFIRQPEFTAQKRRVDRLGVLLLALSMASLQFVLEEGNREGWFSSRLIVILSLTALVGTLLFVRHELTTREPIVDLRIFKGRNYTLATLINFLVGLAMFSGSFLFSLFCGSVLRLSALEIGRVFLVSGMAQIILMPLVGRFASRLDARIFLVIGIGGVSLSLWMSAHLTEQAGFADLLLTQLPRAFGLSLIFIPVSMLALSDVKPQDLGNATGLFSLTRELGGSIGTAWMGQIIERAGHINASILSESVYPQNPFAQQRISQFSAFLRHQQTRLSPQALMWMKLKAQALVLSFNQGFMQAAAAFACGLILVAFIKRAKIRATSTR